MEAKRIVLNAIHPAPYIDEWVRVLEQNFGVELVYNYPVSAAKTWSDYSGRSGVNLEDISLFELIRKYGRSDLAIFSGWFEKSNFISIIALKIAGRRVAVFSDHPKQRSGSGVKNLIKRLFLNLFVDYILCATKGTGDFYAETLRIDRNKLLLFPYGLSGLNGESIVKQERCNPHQSGSVRKLKIFVANNFRPSKGYQTLLDALQLLDQDGLLSNFQFTIAGTGEQFESFDRKFTDLKADIILLGWIEVQQYEEHMRSADIFVHASNFEPFGIPPLDAMNVNTVVISSNGVQSVLGVIENGVSGYLFESGSAEKLAETLVESWNNRKNLPTIAEAARSLVKAEFDPNIWILSVEQCLRTGLPRASSESQLTE